MTTQRQGTLPNAAVEDYLKTIYQHTEWQDEPITPSALASKLAVAPASVTGMVKKLAALGLVDHVPYGPLNLTEEGTSRAIAVVRRHRLIETWLVRDLGYSWDEVHDEAELLEHSVSDRLLSAIDERLGHPTHDPHGDPIPDAFGNAPVLAFVLLEHLEPARQGTVLRIDDRKPELLRLLAANNIRPGSTVTVHERSEYDLTILAEPSGARPAVRLSIPDAQRIWVRQSSGTTAR
ncbi:metal-dependent transcriptional regulator [Arthrobacter sp. TmT3-37]|uniref:metal-dependent transcriptional regulator n=1 Tax=Arthrobacter sp. B1805 TaxID=2058892 RepID=UPI0021588D60|nr:metal-dependent transcriptional regulator [Arthrobacter sp. B1805]